MATARGQHDVVTDNLEIRFEAPDLVRLVKVRRLAAPEIAVMYPAIARFAADRRYILTLVDISLLDDVLSGDREAAFRETLKLPFRGTAVLGANVGLRVILGITFKALRLLGKSDHPLRFFADEADARRWLSQRRAELLAQLADEAAGRR